MGMSEEEIIKTINVNLDKIKSLCTDDCINKTVVIDPLEYALKCLLDLYNKEKEKNKTKIDIKDIEFSNFINERYISKDKIREKFKKVKEECEIELVYQIIDLLEKELLGE